MLKYSQIPTPITLLLIKKNIPTLAGVQYRNRQTVWITPALCQKWWIQLWSGSLFWAGGAGSAAGFPMCNR